MTTDARTAVLALAVLGAIALSGVIVLAALAKSIPDVLGIVIGGAVTGVAGILVPSAPPPAADVNGRHEA